MTAALRAASLLVVAAGLLAGCEPQRSAPEQVSRRQEPTTVVRRCVRVIDGDTIELDGGERVRLIGLDTPELHHPKKPVQYFAREASGFVERVVEGRQVRLEYERNRRDRYGRTLAYVFIGDTLLNQLVIAEGYGHAYVEYPFEHRAEFEAAERSARIDGRGLWAEVAGR